MPKYFDKRLVVDLTDPQIKKKFKLLCAIKGVSMGEYIQKLVENEIEHHKDKLEGLN